MSNRMELLWGKGLCVWMCACVCMCVWMHTPTESCSSGRALSATSPSRQDSRGGTERPDISRQLTELRKLALCTTTLVSHLSKETWAAHGLCLWSWMFGLVKEMNESGWAHHNLHNSLCQQILILPPARSQYVWLRQRSLNKTAITSRQKPTAHSATMSWISLLEWSLRSARRAWTTGLLRWGPSLAISTHVLCPEAGHLASQWKYDRNNQRGIRRGDQSDLMLAISKHWQLSRKKQVSFYTKLISEGETEDCRPFQDLGWEASSYAHVGLVGKANIIGSDSDFESWVAQLFIPGAAPLSTSQALPWSTGPSC